MRKPCKIETTTRQSRKAWVKTNGPIPDGLQVLHRCDQPLCREITHLFLGTPLDNTQDMIAKGREGWDKNIKIPNEIIRRWIRGERAVDLAQEIGCHPMSISHAARNRR